MPWPWRSVCGEGLSTKSAPYCEYPSSFTCNQSVHVKWCHSPIQPSHKTQGDGSQFHWRVRHEIHNVHSWTIHMFNSRVNDIYIHPLSLCILCWMGEISLVRLSYMYNHSHLLWYVYICHSGKFRVVVLGSPCIMKGAFNYRLVDDIMEGAAVECTLWQFCASYTLREGVSSILHIHNITWSCTDSVNTDSPRMCSTANCMHGD